MRVQRYFRKRQRNKAAAEKAKAAMADLVAERNLRRQAEAAAAALAEEERRRVEADRVARKLAESTRKAESMLLVLLVSTAGGAPKFWTHRTKIYYFCDRSVRSKAWRSRKRVVQAT